MERKQKRAKKEEKKSKIVGENQHTNYRIDILKNASFCASLYIQFVTTI